MDHGNISFLALWLLLATTICAQSDCQRKRLECVKSRSCVVQGTNLGSWFVLESWMTPGIFTKNGCNRANDGQYLFEKCLGGNAPRILEQHWSTWITASDFQMMSSKGVNLVRVPVGWWQIYDDVGGADKAHLNYFINPMNYTVGSLKYLDKTFEWGEKYGIAVLVDMHAAPGSQNGEPHSSPPAVGEKDWDKYQSNVGQTVDSMELYAKRYANRKSLFGFALLNEPKAIVISILKDYYKKAYAAIRKHSPDSWIIINPLINNQNIDQNTWTGFMNPDQGFQKVAMDAHWYACFGGPSDKKTANGNIDYVNTVRRNAINNYNKVNPKPLLIGEWSGCWSVGNNNRIGEYIQAQINVYNNAKTGWTYWSWAPGTNGNQWSLKTAFNERWIGNLKTPC